MTGWIYLHELPISSSELCFLVFVIPTLLFGYAVLKAGGDTGRDTPPHKAGHLCAPMGIWGQLVVCNIFLTRYVAERNIFLWNCIN